MKSSVNPLTPPPNKTIGLLQFIKKHKGKERVRIYFYMLKYAMLMTIGNFILVLTISVGINNDDNMGLMWLGLYVFLSAAFVWEYRRKPTIKSAGVLLGCMLPIIVLAIAFVGINLL